MQPSPNSSFYRNIIFIVLSWTLLVPSAWGQSSRVTQSQAERFVVEQVVSGLGVPWAMAFLSPDKMLVTERAGYINMVSTKTGKVRRLKGVPSVMAEGQGGMLDVAVPPEFKSGGWIYFTYVRDQQGQGVTTLARAKLNADRLVSWQELLVTKSATETGQHFGSRIAFDKQGYVYFGVGDRGLRPNAQKLSNHAGTVMRLHRDGRVPKDNPFVNKKGALPEIWSYGHRNPQGIAYDYANKRLWLIEHGPRGGDEINLVLSGRNYGWPVISYGKEYWAPVAVGEGTHRSGMEQPVKQFTPSIAPGSLLFYSGKAFPAWRGNLFSGALKLQHLNRVVIDSSARAVTEERLLENMSERIRALAESPQGWIYFSTDSGRILRLKPVTRIN
jgi:glucose/arabinose dehydrogenase